MAAQQAQIYQLKITLKYSKPPIWRRIQVPDTIGLSKLHTVFQIVMGWEDEHLHQFICNEIPYMPGEPDMYDFLRHENSRKYKLKQLLKQPKDWLIYEYDFGDYWQHKVVLEKILPMDQYGLQPRCIAGKGACPPEDIGGIGGYYEFLAAVADPESPERDYYEERFEDLSFDPDRFDINQINLALIELVKK
ncbi:MAG: plasmid pRiA4b ORF-3 family protein [Myxococcales bacterium]|nr:plasmid pRiA4b ORF-3 family protein [Myxococcales bacterium]